MTRAEAKWAIANPETLKAMADGEAIQYRNPSGSVDWEDVLGEHFGVEYLDYEFRKKPDPKLRPWRVDEVPVGALMRMSKSHRETNPDALDNDLVTTILSSSVRGFQYAGGSSIVFVDAGGTAWENVPKRSEYSTDGGKTWNPAGVMEG